MLKNVENNGREEIVLVTPTPDVYSYNLADWSNPICI